MIRPIEAVLADAQRRLEFTGRLEIRAFLSAYPEHAAELEELLPVMLHLHQEKRWLEAERQSRSFAAGLFAQLSEQGSGAAEPSPTLGSLFERERLEAGLSLEEQARRSGLPVQALEALTRDKTPLSRLDNSSIKQLAGKVAAPFAALIKEVRRLASLESLTGSDPGLVFTRDAETSTEEERQALLEKVRQAARKPPEKQ